jgi:flagellar biosynthesis/type III secretory pathway protein FliH
MATESGDQEVEGMDHDPTTDGDPDDAPLPVRQKITGKPVRKDAGPRVAPPSEKLDPRFEAAKARIEKQEQLAAERRRLKAERDRQTQDADDAAEADESGSEEGKTTFSFNMTGERREPQQ